MGPFARAPWPSSQGVRSRRCSRRPTPPPASAFSSIVEIIHPQSLALRTGMPGGGFRADRAATSGNGVPLRLPPCGALRQWIRARHDAPPRGADALAGEAFRGRGCCSSGLRGPFSGQQRSALPRHGGFQWAPMVNLAILCAATTTDSPVQASQALRRVRLTDSTVREMRSRECNHDPLIS